MQRFGLFLVSCFGLAAFIFSALAYKSAGLATDAADHAAFVAGDAVTMATKAEDRARIGSWHLMVAQTGPHVGMAVTLRDAAGLEQAAVLLRKTANGGWILAVFDEPTTSWKVTGPHVEGTREELGTWTPAICGGVRPGFTGFDHEGHDHGGRGAADAWGER